MSDPVLYALLFAGSLCVYLPIYRYLVARWSSDYVVRRVESGDIDLNYLLEAGGVFDELAKRVVTKFRQSMNVELGRMVHESGSGTSGEIAGDPQLMGLDAAGELLKMVGMRKPPVMLQYKVAEALGRMIAQQAPADDFEQFKP